MNILIKFIIISTFIPQALAVSASSPWPWDHKNPPPCTPNKTATQGIASLALASDEILFGLLFDQPKLLKSLSPLATNPEYSNVSALVLAAGVRLSDKVEEIAGLRPGVVFAASYNRVELRTQLRQLGATVVVLRDFKSIAAIDNNIATIGSTIGCAARAAALIEALKAAIASSAQAVLERRGKGPAPQVMVYSEDLVFPGKGTVFDSLTTQLGIVNLTGQNGLLDWPKLAAEYVVTLRPQWLLYPSAPRTSGAPPKPQLIGPAWSYARGLPPNRILTIPKNLLLSVSQYLGPLAQQLAKNVSTAEPTP